LRVSMGYPSREDERNVLSSHRTGEPVDDLQPVLSCSEIRRLQDAVREVTVDDAIYDYILDMVDLTRNSEELHIGISTRGALALYRAAQAMAFIEGRTFVVPDDVKNLAVPVFSHRVVAKGHLYDGQRQTIESVVTRLIEKAPMPE